MAQDFNSVVDRQASLNYVAPQSFYLTIEHLPQVVFNCQQLNVPVVSGGEAPLSNRFNPTRTFIPGDGVDYSQLDVTFLIDKEFKTYRTVLEWLKAANSPDNEKQFPNWVDKSDATTNDSRYGALMSNMTVFGTDASNQPLVQWNLVNAFPISLDGPQYDASNPDIEYLTSTVSFRFSYFTHQTYTGGVLNNDIL